MSGMAKLLPGLGAAAGEVPGEKGPIPVVGVVIPWGPEEEETLWIELHAAQSFQVDLNAAIAAAIKKQNDNRKKRRG
jgi:hypothetical protein